MFKKALKWASYGHESQNICLAVASKWQWRPAVFLSCDYHAIGYKLFMDDSSNRMYPALRLNHNVACVSVLVTQSVLCSITEQRQDIWIEFVKQSLNSGLLPVLGQNMIRLVLPLEHFLRKTVKKIIVWGPYEMKQAKLERDARGSVNTVKKRKEKED